MQKRNVKIFICMVFRLSQISLSQRKESYNGLQQRKSELHVPSCKKNLLRELLKEAYEYLQILQLICNGMHAVQHCNWQKKKDFGEKGWFALPTVLRIGTI